MSDDLKAEFDVLEAWAAEELSVAEACAKIVALQHSPHAGGVEAGLRDALELILPLAKGYAAQHSVGNSHQFIRKAEAALSTPPAHPEPVETGWLIEAWNSKTGAFGARWWAGYSAEDQKDGDGWTSNSLIAMRFGRERDAQAYIDETGWTEAKPTDHRWGPL